MVKIDEVEHRTVLCYSPRQARRATKVIPLYGVGFETNGRSVELFCCTEWKDGRCSLMGSRCRRPDTSDNGGPIRAILAGEVTEYPG